MLILALLLCSAVASAGISFTAVQAGSIPATPGSEGQIKVSLVTDETIPLSTDKRHFTKKKFRKNSTNNNKR